MTMTSHQSRALVVIDPSVQDYQYLVKNVHIGHEVHVLNPTQDGVDEITQLLSARQDLESIHIVSHGKPGELFLGSTQLNLKTLGQYATAIQTWTNALKQQASIFLYGCQVAAQQQGQRFVRQLRNLAGVEIAASANLTGHKALGGDWALEFVTGTVQAGLAFQPQALAAYPHVLAVLLNETFRNATVSATPWLFGTSGANSANPFLTAGNNPAPVPGGLPGSTIPIDPVGDGVLRLTNNTSDQSAFVIYNNTIPVNAGLTITFDFFAYNGTGAGTRPGGDGISFFLIDGAQSPTLAGAFGGSLGYAQKSLDAIPGIVGGYIGVGLDEYGNFANPGDAPNSTGQREGGPGEIQDAVTVRGSGNGLTGYGFVGTSGTLTPGIDNVTATNRADATRKARIDITPTGLLSVKLDLNNDGDFADTGETTAALSNIDIIGANGGILPASFKFGFASSTGNATNIHEIRNLAITTFSTPPAVTDATVPVNPNSTVNVIGLSGTDAETSITSYTITTIPDPTQGILYLGNPGSGGTPVTAGQVLTPDQLSQLFFQAQPGFTGGSFTYRATDTDGDTTQVPGTVTLTLQGNNANPLLPGDKTTPVSPQNPTNLTGLEGRDPDGTIPAYIISTIPPTNQGTLFIGNPDQGGTPVTQGQRLSPTQLDQLFFRPGPGFTNTNFTYVAIDNQGALSTPRTITLSTLSDNGGGTSDCAPGIKRKGTNGNNTLVGGPDSDQLQGKNGNDTLRGKDCNDVLRGGRGNDKAFGNNDRDKLFGNQSNDRLDGGKGNDLLNAGLGRDRAKGGGGNDTVLGKRGNDTLNGNSNDDVVQGGRGNDKIKGDGGDDIIDGNQNKDRLDGGKGSDFLNGGLQKDILLGRSGSDVMIGGRGYDRLKGGSQGDEIIGGVGRDTIVGGGGADLLQGGSGRDRFIYGNARHGVDEILDFAKADRINVRGIFAKGNYSSSSRFNKYIRLQQVGSDTIVRIDANGNSRGGFVTLCSLDNVSASVLGANNFLV